jgi:hypothetical protein
MYIPRAIQWMTLSTHIYIPHMCACVYTKKPNLVNDHLYCDCHAIGCCQLPSNCPQVPAIALRLLDLYCLRSVVFGWDLLMIMNSAVKTGRITTKVHKGKR